MYQDRIAARIIVLAYRDDRYARGIVRDVVVLPDDAQDTHGIARLPLEPDDVGA